MNEKTFNKVNNILKVNHILMFPLSLYGIWNSKVLLVIVAMLLMGIGIVIGWVLPGFVD